MDGFEIAALVGAGVGLLSLVGAWAGAGRTDRRSRLLDAERRVDELEADYNDLWLWARALVDHIYRGHSAETMPKPPERRKRT